ncbi:MAG TPA: MFS transporter [Ilumatobacteraceae bacterium]|nr:MFS transporter [Ilumatobacteraceae bacterium]HRB02720.1 MFS transporter [Ilumatobacteraceae bacterium]
MQTELAPGPWSPLRVRVYRWLWIAGLASNIGTFMHLVAANWTMATLSSSPTLVSLVQASWAVPGFLLALHAGAFADLLDRRRFIIATQVAALLVAAALAVAQGTGMMTPPVLLAGTFLESMALTFAAPAFMALTPELVDAQTLPQAIGLDGISRNAAQTIGPALAGGVIALTGPGGVFVLNAVSFLGVIAVVNGYRGGAVRPERPEAINAAIREGVRHVKSRAALRNPIIRLATITAAGAGLVAVMPLVAKERLRVSATGFGLLSAALGLGSVGAVWVLPRLHAPRFPERAVLISAFVWSAGAALFAGAERLWVGVVAMLFAGAGTMAMLNVLFSNYTLKLEGWVRGRASALAMLMVWLGTSVGAVAWGGIATGIGIRDSLYVAAAFNVLLAVVAPLFAPVTPYSGDSDSPAAASGDS